MKTTIISRSIPAPLAALLLAACAAQPAADGPQKVLYQAISEDAHPVFASVARDTARSERLPARVTFDAADEATADFRLDLDFRVRSKGIGMTEEVWQQTTTMLLTLYPSTCGRYELELTGDLYDQSGTRLRTWHIVEQDTAFLWLFHGKDCGRQQSEISVRKIASSMLERLYARMSKDGTWSGPAVAPASDDPLVHVEAVNARELVERVTKTDAPFANFTFDAESAGSVDRTVRIQYYFNRSDQGIGSAIGRGMGAMATLGLMSMCPPNEMVITADVTDGDGSVLKSYRFGKKKRAASKNYCAAPTASSHPKLAAGLLRKVFREIRKDEVIGYSPD